MARMNRFFIVSLMACLFACATVPLTERRSLNLVPDSEIIALSLQQYKEVLGKSKLSQDEEKVQMVKRVGERIARAAEEFMRESGREADVQGYQWEFNLIDDPKVVNAWCMPGGKVAVYTGILPVAKDETGLAVIVGHEVAHAIAKHGNERMSQAMLVQLGGIGLSLALTQKPAITRQIFQEAYGITTKVGYVLPYSRLQEAEADRIGLVLMAKAGYDPREAIALWERMSRREGGRTVEFLSTHPVPETRIENIKSLLPEAMRYYKGDR